MNKLESSIQVEVKTEYIDAQSSPEEDKYLFSYTITIINLGNQNVTLKTRHWYITDSNAHETEVYGIGVVGETPTIKPDSAYQYTSGTILKTPVGIMHGHYKMQTDSGQEFTTLIPAFHLAIPGVVH